MCLLFVPSLCKDVCLNGVSDSCLPTAEAANRLATLKLKQSRNGVARPFVFMDMGAFVPEWATVVVCCIFK